jgi:hypothetical protein
MRRSSLARPTRAATAAGRRAGLRRSEGRSHRPRSRCRSRAPLGHAPDRGHTGDGITFTPWNPLPAQGGIDPEPIEQASEFAPLAFRKARRRAGLAGTMPPDVIAFPGGNDRGVLRPAELAVFTPAVADTLILNPLS